ncbi:unnamed protein product [Closterium sp. NIES-54]
MQTVGLHQHALVTLATALPFPLSFVPRTPPAMYITLYYLVTRLPDSLSSVRDQFLSLCPTELTVDLLEKSVLAVGASRGDCRTHFFGGCSPVPLLPSVASADAVDLVGTEEVGAASAPSGRCRNSKGKGSMGGGGDGGGGDGGGGGAGSGGFSGGGGGGVGSGSGVAQRGGFGGSQRQQQPRSRETPSAQQLREWKAGRGRSGGAGPCTYVLRTGSRRGETCGLPHTAQRCFGRLTDAWRAQFPDAVELPRWHDLLRQNVPIYDLDFDAILAAMYALTDIDEGDYYLSVPPDPGIEAAALGASASAAPGIGESAAPRAGESAPSGTAPTEALHTFTHDSGASRSFFRDSTTLTPLRRPVSVSLADPSWGPVLAHSSTVLPCPAAPSRLLSGLHLPSFSTNLVSGADLQDAWVDQFAPGGQRVTHCTCSQTGRHLATFTRRPGSSLYTLTTVPPLVSAAGQVAASSRVFAAASRYNPASAPCSCRPLSHETLLWHHRLGHPSLPRLQGMASRTLVSGLPRSLPPLPPGPAPTCVPCVEGRQHTAPHSSTFPPTEDPLQTLHMDVWGPAHVLGQGHERHFLLVVDDYSRYTTVFPLRSKGEVPEVLIDWIRGARRQLSERFGSDLPVLHLHSDRGGEFSSDLLRAFCRAEGICQTFTLPASPQQNGIAERRIGMVMDVARTSMIHAAAPHFLWPFAVQYAAHQINLQPRVSLPETTPTLSDTSTDKLSSRVVPCVLLGFPPDAIVPHLVSMLLGPEGDPDAPDIPTPRSYAEAIEGPYSSQWQAAMDTEMASWKSTGTYVDEVPPPGANIVSGMWIFRVKRPPGSPPAFKARYVALGFSQRQGVDFFQTFFPTLKMTTLRVLLHVAAQRDYELHSLDFSTTFLQGNLHEEIWLRRPPGFTGSFPSGTQWSLRRPVYGLRQAPHDLVFATADTEALAHVKSELQKRHTCTDLGELTSYLGLRITRDRAQRTITLTQSHMVQQVLQRFGFTYSSPQSTPLPTSHSLSAPPSDESVEPSGPYPELVGCLMYLMTCTVPDLAYPLSLLARYVAHGRHRKVHWDAAKRVLRYLCSTSGMGLVLGGRARVVLTGHADASWVDDLATQRSSQGYTFNLGSGSVSWRSTRSSSVLNSSCEAEIYDGAMDAQELRWLTYLLTDLGEALRSPPVLYVNNKAMLALCQEHRLEHRTKHIALRYFLPQELQQRGQLRLGYVASQANTADVFTKALQPCDHQRFCIVLGLVPTVPHILAS